MNTTTTDQDRQSGIKVSDTDAGLWAELLFTFLPFLIIFTILIFKGGISSLHLIPEWSLAAAILAGQTLVKFITGLLKYGKAVNLGVVALIISAIIVFLLSPSLIILALIMLSPSPTSQLGIVQILIFILSVAVFLLLGKVSQEILLDLDKESQSD